MSTNFYATIKSTVKRVKPTEIHIGKRSGGWVFSFQSYQPQVTGKLRAWDDWKEFLAIPGIQIEDEYARAFTVEEFEREVFETLEPWGPAKIKPKGKTPSDHAPEYGGTMKTTIDTYGFSHSEYEFS